MSHLNIFSHILLFTISVLFPFCSYSSPQTNTLDTHTYSIPEGLPSNKINCIIQASNGILYIGTHYGLCKYDGVHFTSIPLSNTHYNISKIEKDDKDNLWIATFESGLIYFDTHTEQVTIYHNTNKNTKLKNLKHINTMCLDKALNTLWIGTKNKGVYQLNLSTMNLKTIPFEKGIEILALETDQKMLWIGTHQRGTLGIEKNSFRLKYKIEQEHQIWKIKRHNQLLWLGTENGLTSYHIKDQSTHYYLKQNRKENIIRDIVFENDSIVWIASQENGLYRLNIQNGDHIHYLHNPTDMHSLNENTLLTLLSDKDKNLWIGTWTGGVNQISLRNEKFKKILSLNPYPNSNQIWSICYKDSQSVWLGTHALGLCQYSMKENYYSQSQIIKCNEPLTKIYSSTDQLLLGSWSHGVAHLNPHQYSIQHPYTPIFKDSLSVYSFYRNPHHNLYWIGTTQKGLFTYTKGSGLHKEDRFSRIYHVLSNKDIRGITQDSKGNLWIATRYSGVYRCIISKDSIYKCTQLKLSKYSNRISTKHKALYNILCDSKDRIWIASEAGVLCYNPLIDHLRTYTEQNGLCNNIVSDIIEDDQHRIWASTWRGISLILPNHSIQNFFLDHTFYSIYLHPDLNLIFAGSDKELFVINPKNLPQEELPENLILTNLEIDNKTILPNTTFKNDTILKKCINETASLDIPSGHNNFTIRFTQINLNQYPNAEISYTLENNDPEWFYLQKNENQITYTNLSSGKYILKISMENGKPQSPQNYKEITIHILPMWYQTVLFKITIGVLLFLLLSILIFLIVKQVQLKQNLIIEKLQNENNTKLNKMKISFFTNLSHELKTPLTLIKGPIEALEREYNTEDNKHYFQIINKNMDSLSNLIYEILDFKKIENGKLELHCEQQNFTLFLRSILDLFEQEIAQKGIAVRTNFPIQDHSLIFDSEKLKYVFVNILGNALKFTNAENEITLKLEIQQKHTIVEIIDTGIGIAPEDLDKIFDPFYQPNHHKNQGTGLGLSISKSIVELHKGSIKVNSQLHKGTTFTISLPNYNLYPIETIKPKQPETPNTKEYSLLLVDDNQDMLYFLDSILKEKYHVICEKDSRKVLDIASLEIPSLIVLDIMMPNIDGIQLCKELKNNLHTSHIPIILLSAKHSLSDQIEGLESGADIYLKKPFNIEILKNTIHNTIKTQIKQQEVLRKKVTNHQNELAQNDVDSLFLKNLVEYIHEHISDEELKVEDLATKLNMTHSTLYRKVKGLTGLSINGFIREIRLNKAYQLITETSLNISEVMWKTGFNHASYFSRCFKKQFHILPSECKRKCTEIHRN